MNLHLNEIPLPLNRLKGIFLSTLFILAQSTLLCGCSSQSTSDIDKGSISINSINCSSINFCVAATDDALFITVDGGVKWVKHVLDKMRFLSVNCPSDNVCFTIDANGSVWKTMNQGETWVISFNANTHSNFRYSKILCPSTSVCFTIGKDMKDGGQLLFTNNGGVSWSTKATAIFFDISCPTEKICFSVTGKNYSLIKNNGTVTINEGIKFNVTSDSFSEADKITCPAEETCYAVGEGGSIIATFNGGKTWNSQSASSIRSFLTPTKRQPMIQPNTSFETWQLGFKLTNISCPSINTCYTSGYKTDTSNSSIVGEPIAKGMGGGILKTTNSGLDWSYISSLDYNYFKDLFCPETHACFVIDKYKNRIFYTKDAGLTWNAIVLV